MREQPKNPQALFALAQIALKFNAYEDALPLLVQSSQLMPEYEKPLLQLAHALTETHRLEEAERCYQQLLTRFPQFSQGYFFYAGFSLANGKKVDAENLLRKTLELEPQHTGALLALSGLIKITDDNPLMKQMLGLLEQLKTTSNKNQIAVMQLHYALGKAFDDQKNYQLAFEHWQQANQLQLKHCSFRVNQMLPLYTQLKTVFNESLLSNKSIQTQTTLTPIFIVGMPRSGSTLLEQMLSSHKQIESAGEVNYISTNIVSGIEQMTGKSYPLGVEQLTQQQLVLLGNHYLEKLQKRHPDSQYIIDKLPANFQSIGLIKIILPQAKIIHLQRHPLAISLSVYRNYFAENEPYFCDLNEFTKYFHAYTDLMQHWHQALDQEIVELTYEKLIENPKQQINKILKSCNLRWQDSCLNFHLQQKNVQTLSVNQVTEPLYKSSLSNWQHYSDFLENTAGKFGEEMVR